VVNIVKHKCQGFVARLTSPHLCSWGFAPLASDVVPHAARPSVQRGSNFAGMSDASSGYSAPASRGRSSAESYNKRKTNPCSRALTERGACSAAHNQQRHRRTGYRPYTYNPLQDAAPPTAVEQEIHLPASRTRPHRTEPPYTQLTPTSTTQPARQTHTTFQVRSVNTRSRARLRPRSRRAPPTGPPRGRGQRNCNTHASGLSRSARRYQTALFIHPSHRSGASSF
jgi:hypothetical protein